MIPLRATINSLAPTMSSLTPTPLPNALPDTFFDRDAQLLARELLGKVIRHKVGDLWLAARIIETEAYYLEESVRLCFWMADISTCITLAVATR